LYWSRGPSGAMSGRPMVVCVCVCVSFDFEVVEFLERVVLIG
jgi:hypothetical protein